MNYVTVEDIAGMIALEYVAVLELQLLVVQLFLRPSCKQQNSKDCPCKGKEELKWFSLFGRKKLRSIRRL